MPTPLGKSIKGILDSKPSQVASVKIYTHQVATNNKEVKP